MTNKIDANYMINKLINYIDLRTLFDLTLKEAFIRYINRIVILTSIIMIPFLYLYTKINALLGWSLLILFVAAMLTILLYCRKESKKELLAREIKHNSGDFMNELHAFFDKSTVIDKSDILKIKKFLLGIKILEKQYSKTGDIEKYILCNRYHITLLLDQLEYSKASAKTDYIEKYISKLPEKMKKKNEIRAEIARFLVTHSTVLLSKDISNYKDALNLLEKALDEFRKLNLEKEVVEVEKQREDILYKVKTM